MFMIEATQVMIKKQIQLAKIQVNNAVKSSITRFSTSCAGKDPLIRIVFLLRCIFEVIFV